MSLFSVDPADPSTRHATELHAPTWSDYSALPRPGSRHGEAPKSRSNSRRTAVLQALDTDFATGRLDHFEHTRTATKAKYIDELRPLVGDLGGAGGRPGTGLG